MLLTEGQMSDYKGAALMFESLPQAKVMIAGVADDAQRHQAMMATGSTRH